VVAIAIQSIANR